jgi:hypothetical protein
LLVDRVSLELSDQCHRQNSAPMAMAMAQVEVNFTASPSRSEFTQNDSNQGMGGNLKNGFRKNGAGGTGSRGKERKKELMSSGGSSGHRSLLHNPNDITGIPLKDDSSKASLPSQHFGPITVGFLPDKGWTFAAHNTPLEIAMYVLLGVFSVAILVFVASCFVYASRVKKRDVSHSDELMGFKMDGHPGLGGVGGGGTGVGGGAFGIGNRSGGGCTNAHDWVWLGRASLALHPSLDSTKHPAFSSTHSGNKPSGVSYDAKNGPTSGVNPIRIITNPNFDSLTQQQQQQILLNQQQHPQAGSSHSSSPQSQQQGSSSRQQQPFGGRGSGSSSTDPPRLAPPPRPPKPLQQSPIDSGTFSVKSPSGQGGGSCKVGAGSPPGSSNGSVSGDCPDYRPPVPPHRNIPLGHPESSGSVSPPMRGTGSGPASTKSSSSSSSSHSQFLPSSSNSHHNSNLSKSKKSSSRGKESSTTDELPNPCYVDFADQNQLYHPPKGCISSSSSSMREPSNNAGPLRPANIVGNPMSYIDEESELEDEEDVERPLTVAAASAVANRQSHKMNKNNGRPQNNMNSSVKLDMDYDQLMEYFDNLKETEA